MFASWGKGGDSYRSIFRDSNWLLEPPFLTVKVLRKLTGILELPGMMGELSREA